MYRPVYGSSPRFDGGKYYLLYYSIYNKVVLVSLMSVCALRGQAHREFFLPICMLDQ